MLALEAMEFTARETKQISGFGVVSAGGDDVEMGIIHSESGCGGGRFGDGGDGLARECGELGPVGRDPVDDRQELFAEDHECGIFQ